MTSIPGDNPGEIIGAFDVQAEFQHQSRQVVIFRGSLLCTNNLFCSMHTLYVGDLATGGMLYDVTHFRLWGFGAHAR